MEHCSSLQLLRRKDHSHCYIYFEKLNLELLSGSYPRKVRKNWRHTDCYNLAWQMVLERHQSQPERHEGSQEQAKQQILQNGKRSGGQNVHNLL